MLIIYIVTKQTGLYFGIWHQRAAIFYPIIWENNRFWASIELHVMLNKGNFKSTYGKVCNQLKHIFINIKPNELHNHCKSLLWNFCKSFLHHILGFLLETNFLSKLIPTLQKPVKWFGTCCCSRDLNLRPISYTSSATMLVCNRLILFVGQKGWNNIYPMCSPQNSPQFPFVRIQ